MSKKEKCLVYGGGGFIGSHLCEELLSKNYDVTIFDKTNFSKKNIEHFIDDVNITEGDFNNEVDIRNSLRDTDYVFHLVSSTLPADSNENPIYDVETNLISSIRLFKECVSKKIKKVIFLSSGGTVYGIPGSIPIMEDHPSNPICSYGIIKKTIEEYLYMFEKIYGLDYIVFRLSNPYGERQNPNASQGVIPVFINKAINNEKIIIWGDGQVVRDYIYIKDAVKVIAASLEKKTKGRIFNLSSGKGYSINDIIRFINEISGRETTVEYTGARSADVPVNILDNELAKKTFGFEPKTNIKEGMKRLYKYLHDLNER
ncbi:MAG: NAD-dependent epimerase/dehydratase family protein [Ignavibacteria bacterium]